MIKYYWYNMYISKRVGEMMSPDLFQSKDTPYGKMLFLTKLSIPVIQQKLVSRIRLDNELNDGLKCRLILVTAPAGFGKTTAVVKWVRHLSMPVAWFSIDSYDNSLKKFWSYLVAALEIILPGIESRFSQYLNTANPIAVQAVVTALIDEISKSKNQFILVLDDYHLIEDATIHESLALLIRYLPDNAHIVIISRSQLPFTTVRLQTTGHVKEIRISHLQFTIDEITCFCREKGISISKDDIIKLESLTEGWAAGLYLILDSISFDGSISRMLSGPKLDNHRIASYLSEEVIDQWSEVEKEFMLKTSILSSMSGPLCNALTGRTDGSEMLESLFKHNAFIISICSDSLWYRYHHLFLEFLQNRLDRTNSSSKAMLHRQAGEWYENNGYLTEAVNHFLQGGDHKKAALIIEKYGRDMLKSGDINALLGWLHTLPVSTVKGSEMLCLTYAWALVLSNRVDEAVPWINILESKCKDDTAEKIDEVWKKQLEGEIAAIAGFVGIKQEKPETALNSIVKYNNLMLDKSIFCGWGLNFNMGEATLLAGMFGIKGHLSIVDKEFIGIYEKTRSFIKSNFGYVPTLMGEILFERNRIDEAFPLLIKGVQEAESSNTPGSFLPAVITLARMMKSRGDISGALEIVKDGERKLKEMGSIHILPLLTAFKVRLSTETGDYDMVDDWMDRNCLDIYDKLSLQRMYEHITLARVLISRKNFDNSMLLLSRLLLFSKKERHLLYTIEISNLQAIVYYTLGDTQMAMEVLNESLKLGEREGYERIYIEEGIPMASLLGRFLRWNIKQEPAVNLPVSPIYIRKIMKHTRDYCITIKTCMNGKSKTQCRPAYIKQPLTKREKDVLRLLDSDLTNAEIAYTLDITLNTVKVNCTNIYKKLEVKNREQAVRNAHELDILG